MFKSCFPNSDLEGNPDDPPDPDGWLSVGHAKYVYNEILQYFATRPDKLFVVITAPPLSASNTSRQAAENARAFNQWLVNDWLAENNYTLPNVAVFDFYNVLTGPDNHHRWNGSQIEHTFTPGMNTLYYPSDDDHPSRLGNEKATAEFVPLLSIFYHRWADAGMNQPVATQPARPTATATSPSAMQEPTPTSPQSPVQSGNDGLLADFDTVTFSHLDAYWDESTATRITCAPSDDRALSGHSSLKVDFDAVSGSWATCVLSFDSPQDWSKSWGLAYSLHAARAGIPYTVAIYAGSLDDQETYLNSNETNQADAGGWGSYLLTWVAFQRAAWEADAGTEFNPGKPVLGIAFGFDGLGDASNTGQSGWTISACPTNSPNRTAGAAVCPAWAASFCHWRCLDLPG